MFILVNISKLGELLLANINIDSKLLEALQQSSCFGLAYAEDVAECKQCDVRGSCKAKMEGALTGTPTPMTKAVPEKPKKEDKPSKPKASAKKETASKPSTPKASSAKPKAPKAKPKASTATNPNMPDFKSMSLDELKDLAKERKVEWREYGNDNITRMRLTMALKKSY